MEQSYKPFGWSLVTGCLLMVVTMILHPTGGSFEQIINIATMAIVAHSIAIFSVPFTWVGFWGLQLKLTQNSFLSLLAFAFASIALIAAVIAAALNGLVLPFFVQRYAEADPQLIEQLTHITRYGFFLNHAFDYILMGGVAASMLVWSWCVVRDPNWTSWIGYLGISLTLGLLIALISGVNLVGLFGFRIFIFGWVIWVVTVSIKLIRN